MILLYAKEGINESLLKVRRCELKVESNAECAGFQRVISSLETTNAKPAFKLCFQFQLAHLASRAGWTPHWRECWRARAAASRRQGRVITLIKYTRNKWA
jgi:hypothetical protein